MYGCIYVCGIGIGFLLVGAGRNKKCDQGGHANQMTNPSARKSGRKTVHYKIIFLKILNSTIHEPGGLRI
jgi:hypothetical protein